MNMSRAIPFSFPAFIRLSMVVVLSPFACFGTWKDSFVMVFIALLFLIRFLFRFILRQSFSLNLARRAIVNNKRYDYKPQEIY